MQKYLTRFPIFGCLLLGYLASALTGAEPWDDTKEVADEVNSINCQEGLSLNFSNAYVTEIRGNFIKSPFVKCIDMANNHLQYIQEGALESLTNLMYLNLSENNLRNINLLSFGGYKTLRILSLDRATVYGGDLKVNKLHPELRYLSLRHNQLGNIFYYNQTKLYPSAEPILTAFPKIMYMDLSKNALQKINLYSNGTLKYLYLQENQLSLVYAKSLNNLLLLNVDNNVLSAITYDYVSTSITLEGLEKLRWLSIVNNQVSYISPNAFSDTRELMFLNLTNNQLRIIQPRTLNPLLSLEQLILDNNELNYMPNVTVEIPLRNLSLYKNRIKSIPDKIFISLPFLERLNLSVNLVERVDAGAFNGLKRLEYLDLANNKLTSLPENWCATLTSLHFLDLSSNFFTSLQSLSLMDVMPLQQLNLYNHRLKSIHAPFVRNLPENVTINLSKAVGENTL